MAEYIITEKGKRAKDEIKSPDGKAIIQYTTEHTKVNTDELKLMLGIVNAQGECESLERAGFVRKVDEGKW